MITKCECLHCGGGISFDDDEFYTTGHDFFRWYGPAVQCPHCQSQTKIHLPRKRHPIFNLSPKTIGICLLILLGCLIIISGGLIPILKLALIILVICIYFLPTIVGWSNRNILGIFILNGFLGWTLIGWVGALIWATLEDSTPTQKDKTPE